MVKATIDKDALPPEKWWKTLSGRIVKRFKKMDTTQLSILGELQNRTVYQGTANRNKVAKRRAKNRVARRQRRINRVHS